MKKYLCIAMVLTIVLTVIFAKVSSKSEKFKQAEDFPRDALIYIQIQDLPALIKLWNDSELRRKYLESANFVDFQRRHLALKLAARASEISEAVNIFPDLSFFSGISETSAAIGVYDIGKMEFVLIAPMTDEKFLASKLFQIQTDFDEIKIDDETTVFSKEIEVDRGRQTQKILFTSFRGRLILATSEKYFLQTLSNIKGKFTKNRLTNDSAFTRLAAKTDPQLATVWLDQQKLNNDWYFRQYWLMSEIEDLKNLRSAMFDFAILETKLVEKRVFLTTEKAAPNKIKPAEITRISALIPDNVPFYEIESAEKINLDDLVGDVLFDKKNESNQNVNVQTKEVYSFDDWGKSYSYSYLDNDFDKKINETKDKIDLPDKNSEKTNNELSRVIIAAAPSFSVKLFSPKTLPPPLFFDNRKAIIFSLLKPADLNRANLESTISNKLRDYLTVNTQKTDFVWTDLELNGIAVRQLILPALGRKIFYVFKQSKLIFSNNENFLIEIFSDHKNPPTFDENLEKFTVIKINDGRDVFDDVFQTLETDENNSGYVGANEFFSNNIGSLLDLAADVERIEIKKTSAQNFLYEEIDFFLKPTSK